MLILLAGLVGVAFLVSLVGNVFLMLQNKELMRRLTNGPWCKDFYGEQAMLAELRGKKEAAARIAELGEQPTEPEPERTNENI